MCWAEESEHVRGPPFTRHESKDLYDSERSID